MILRIWRSRYMLQTQGLRGQCMRSPILDSSAPACRFRPLLDLACGGNGSHRRLEVFLEIAGSGFRKTGSIYPFALCASGKAEALPVGTAAGLLRMRRIAATASLVSWLRVARRRMIERQLSISRISEGWMVIIRNLVRPVFLLCRHSSAIWLSATWI